MLNLINYQLQYMKFFFNIICLIFLSNAVFSKIVEAQYTVKGKGFVIGDLFWTLQIENKFYKTGIELNSSGPLSLLYNFRGSYASSGIINNGKLSPRTYNQKWVTKKKTREVFLSFKDLKIKELKLKPQEKEVSRVSYYNLENYNDPLTSFINILLKKESLFTIDGRRIYLFSPEKKEKFVKILIKNYKNLWADHKRNDLESLEVYSDEESVLPKKIKIKFKGSVFLLIKN